MTHDPKLIEAMARAHYEAINLRIHGNVWPTWKMDERKPAFCADMEAALTALCAARPDVAALLRGDAVAVALRAQPATTPPSCKTCSLPMRGLACLERFGATRPECPQL